MTLFRRTLHHAGWFALLGPLMGVPVTIVGEALNHSHAPALLLQILSLLPIFIILAWYVGGIPALLTGVIAAFLPSRMVRCTWQRVMVYGALGAIIASLHWLLLGGMITPGMLWKATGPGLLAGVIMGALMPYLPGRGDARR